MLLLYRSLRKMVEFANHKFTFHYASTLSNTRLWNGLQRYNLHSIMLLLYLADFYINNISNWVFSFYFIEWDGDGSLGPYLIYIPLCFYFIGSDAERWSHACDLHSIMLLLYLPRTDRWSSTENIYIPLCFYFIEGRILHHCVGGEFTFHYASTLSGKVTKTILL